VTGANGQPRADLNVDMAMGVERTAEQSTREADVTPVYGANSGRPG